MVVGILAGATVLLLILLALMMIAFTRRGSLVQEMESELHHRKHDIEELQERYDKKCRQTEQIRSDLEQVREDAKKAKKKAFVLEHRDKDKTPDDSKELDDIQEQAIAQANQEARKAQEEIVRLKDEISRQRELQEKSRQELMGAKKELKEQQEKRNSSVKPEQNRLKELEKENQDIKNKLESLRRKTRTDSQVYKVTKSKLELAMEKIQHLEKLRGGQESSVSAKGNEAPEEGSAHEPTPVPEHQETPILAAAESVPEPGNPDSSSESRSS